MYYQCHLNGSSKPHIRKGVQARKTARINKKGRLMTDKFCPARMICKKDEHGVVSVSYIYTHNHELLFKYTEHQPIPNSVLRYIKSQFYLGASVEFIHRELRQDIGSRINRRKVGKTITIEKKHSITKRQLREIRRKLDINQQKDSDDATSLSYIVNKLLGEPYNPVLLYKPQGEDEFRVGPKNPTKYKIKNDDFFLAIQTEEQMEMFIKHASKIVCLDSTHGTNKYKFKLITLVVQDEFGKGYPVGHLISNGEAVRNLYYFLNSIKERSGYDFSIKGIRLMTDDDNAEWSAFSEVFGDHVIHLLCIWHINRSWNRKLKQILPGDMELRSELHQASVILMGEEEENKFKDMAQKFIEIYSPVCEEYVKYFKKYYLNRPQKWAMCYRHFSNNNTNTNMYVESWHNKLKTTYFQRKFNRRVDKLLLTLLDMEEDDNWRYQMDIGYERQGQHLQATNRHHRGLKISDEDVITVNEFNWNIKAQESKNNKSEVTYEINLIRSECLDAFCYLRCSELTCMGLCFHMYKCSCLDTSRLCKHIHKVHSYRLKTYRTLRFQVTEDQNSINFCFDEVQPTFYHTDVVEQNSKQKAIKFTLQNACTTLDKINEHLQDKIIQDMALKHICNALNDLESYCQTIKNNKTPSNFIELDKIPPATKQKCQPRQKLKPMKQSKKKADAKYQQKFKNIKDTKLIKRKLELSKEPSDINENTQSPKRICDKD